MKGVLRKNCINQLGKELSYPSPSFGRVMEPKCYFLEYLFTIDLHGKRPATTTSTSSEVISHVTVYRKNDRSQFQRLSFVTFSPGTQGDNQESFSAQKNMSKDLYTGQSF